MSDPGPLHLALMADGQAQALGLLEEHRDSPPLVAMSAMYCMGFEAALYLAAVRPEVARATLEQIDVLMLETFGSQQSGLRQRERAEGIAPYEEAYQP